MLETRSRSLPQLSSTRRLTHFIRHTLAWPRLTVKTCFCRLREIQQALGARKKFKILLLWSKALTQSILASNFHNVSHNSNGIFLHWKEYSLWNQTDRAKILGQLRFGAWRRCLHASADSRTESHVSLRGICKSDPKAFFPRLSLGGWTT